MFSQTVESEISVFTMGDKDGIIAVHTVKLDIDAFSIIFVRIENNALNGDGEVEVHYLERSIEDIS